MKLEVGMYVRTKYGIFKIRKITKDLAYWKHEKRVLELDRNIPECNYRFSFYKDESIFKDAKFKDNIMELIEVGDLVTLTTEICKDEVYRVNGVYKGIISVDCFQDGDMCIEDDNELKSIVTKEQFENMQYKVD